MTNQKPSTKEDNLGLWNLIFFLFILPGLFSFSIHYINCQNKVFAIKAFKEVQMSLTKAEEFLKETPKVASFMLFYSKDIKAGNTLNVYNFNQTLPLLGKQEFRLTKNKEEVAFLSKDTKMLKVGSFQPD